METAAKAFTPNRELTTTEIHIAIAQIQDRLTRVAEAQADLTEAWAKPDGTPEFIDAIIEVIRNKYQIPEGVFLFNAEADGALIRADSPVLKKYIAAFVKGRLTEDQLETLIFFFDEIEQCDYGWLLLERSMGFYSLPREAPTSTIESELHSIGTRFSAKSRPLPSLFSFNRHTETDLQQFKDLFTPAQKEA